MTRKRRKVWGCWCRAINDWACPDKSIEFCATKGMAKAYFSGGGYGLPPDTEIRPCYLPVPLAKKRRGK